MEQDRPGRKVKDDFAGSARGGVKVAGRKRGTHCIHVHVRIILRLVFIGVYKEGIEDLEKSRESKNICNIKSNT